MRQHAGVFTANFSSNLLWQNCFAPKKSAFCAEPRRAAAGILDVCQGGATMGLRQTRLLRRMFSYARRPKRPAFVCGEGYRSREGQKPLPHGKKRIPASVCTPRALASRHALARNDSAPRWERRDTWVPPYGVRRSSKADRVVRPYNGTSRTPSPTMGDTNRAKRDVEDAVPYEITRGMCKGADRVVRPYNGTAGTTCPTNRRGAARTAKFRNFFFPLSASAGLRRLYSDDTGRPPVL